MSIIKMSEIDLKDRTLLIREDLNVPIKEGQVTSIARIKATLFTIETAIKAGAKVLLMSHLGRPEEGKYDTAYSLKPVADKLSELLQKPVQFIQDWNSIPDLKSGDVALLENVRFQTGEKKCSPELSQRLANMCDIFVMDAFGTAHRKQASTYGVAEFAKIACAGPLLVAELEALGHALEQPERPLISIVGGSKVSTKLGVLKSIIELSNIVIPGGGIANTLLAAAGHTIGKSLYEPDLIEEAKKLLAIAKEKEVALFLPTDVVVAKEFSEQAIATIKNLNEVTDDDMILDVGPESQQKIAELIAASKTVIWNGPVGVFEFEQFASGTKALAEAIAESDAFSIAGGGDTLAAIEQFISNKNISYISTGGGAFLEFLERHKLPAVSILQQQSLFK